MKTLTVPLPGKEYEIVNGSGLLRQAGERIRAVVPNARRLFIVTDSNVAPLYYRATGKALRFYPVHIDYKNEFLGGIYYERESCFSIFRWT